MQSYAEAKKAGLKPGVTFISPKGVKGVVLAKRAGGKFRVELECATKGCTKKHVRLTSDVFQCDRCPKCAGTRRAEEVTEKAAKWAEKQGIKFNRGTDNKERAQ